MDISSGTRTTPSPTTEPFMLSAPVRRRRPPTRRTATTQRALASESRAAATGPALNDLADGRGGSRAPVIVRAGRWRARARVYDMQGSGVNLRRMFTVGGGDEGDYAGRIPSHHPQSLCFSYERGI